MYKGQAFDETLGWSSLQASMGIGIFQRRYFPHRGPIF